MVLKLVFMYFNLNSTPQTHIYKYIYTHSKLLCSSRLLRVDLLHGVSSKNKKQSKIPEDSANDTVFSQNIHFRL